MVEFKLVSELGEGYRKQYLVEVLLDSQSFSKAQDFSIKGAEQLAAERTLLAINQVDNTID